MVRDEDEDEEGDEEEEDEEEAGTEEKSPDSVSSPGVDSKVLNMVIGQPFIDANHSFKGRKY